MRLHPKPRHHCHHQRNNTRPTTRAVAQASLQCPWVEGSNLSACVRSNELRGEENVVKREGKIVLVGGANKYVTGTELFVGTAEGKN